VASFRAPDDPKATLEDEEIAGVAMADPESVLIDMAAIVQARY
jgi:hypothetical protein